MNNNIEFGSRRDLLFKLVVFGTILILVITTTSFWMDSNSLLFSLINTLICTAISVLLLWLFYATSYRITKNKLHYASGPLKGSIAIKDIKRLELGQTKYAGLKIATARKGVIVHYNKYDEIYISPTDNETFAQALVFVNPDIEVRR